MLQFVYEFLYKFVDKKDFNIMYMDTDSICSAFVSDKIEDLIKPELKTLYEEQKKVWFPRTDTLENTTYDNRTAGLFKTEFTGDGMCALCPKLYYCLTEPYYCLVKPNQNDKFSSKGVQKSNNANLLNYKN